MRTSVQNLKEIIEGWSNLAFEDKKVEEIAIERAKICSECDLYRFTMCSVLRYGKAVKDFEYKGHERKEGLTYSGCGCYIPAKIRSLTSKCALGKW